MVRSVSPSLMPLMPYVALVMFPEMVLIWSAYWVTNLLAAGLLETLLKAVTTPPLAPLLFNTVPLSGIGRFAVDQLAKRSWWILRRVTPAPRSA